MKACFPVARDRGLESRVYPHFGSAPMFLVVDTETKATRAIANPECEHAHGRCHPLDVLADEAIDLVVVSGIGPGALDRLRAAGIRAYHTARGTAGEALEAIAGGALPPVLPEDSCASGVRPHGVRHRHRRGAHGHGPHRFRGGGGGA
jgi:predicted Fe-Mo cluster-binding NifX family protein